VLGFTDDVLAVAEPVYPGGAKRSRIFPFLYPDPLAPAEGSEIYPIGKARNRDGGLLERQGQLAGLMRRTGNPMP